MRKILGVYNVTAFDSVEILEVDHRYIESYIKFCWNHGGKRTRAKWAKIKFKQYEPYFCTYGIKIPINEATRIL
jgi:hypothetical protein